MALSAGNTCCVRLKPGKAIPECGSPRNTTYFRFQRMAPTSGQRRARFADGKHPRLSESRRKIAKPTGVCGFNLERAVVGMLICTGVSFVWILLCFVVTLLRIWLRNESALDLTAGITERRFSNLKFVCEWNDRSPKQTVIVNFVLSSTRGIYLEKPKIFIDAPRRERNKLPHCPSWVGLCGLSGRHSGKFQLSVWNDGKSRWFWLNSREICAFFVQKLHKRFPI